MWMRTSCFLSSRKHHSQEDFILSHPEIELFTPLYVFDELEEHKEEVKSKAKIDDIIFELSKLLEYITVVPLDEFKDSWAEAKQISPDPDDVERLHFLSIVLSGLRTRI